MPELDLEHLIPLLIRKFPAAVIREEGDEVTILTLHGSGPDIATAITNALKLQQDAEEDGKSVRQMLDDVLDDLRTPGMSRARHTSLCEILDLASNAINGGVITGVIPWIQIPSLNREIDNIRYRIDTRLNMIALEMQAREKADHETKKTPTQRLMVDAAIREKWIDGTPQPVVGLIEMRRLQRLQA